MIIVTGAAGFIGSNMISHLIRERFNDLVAVDDFSNPDKNKNLENASSIKKVHRDELDAFVQEHHKFIQFIIHLGARTDTTEFNKTIFDQLNLHYSQNIWKLCSNYTIPLIYASSAATYGMGELGYDDQHEIIPNLKPLNPYGESKNEFDKWVLQQTKTPFFWAGLKFFNVYGPNEYHKGRMASVIFHAFHQIQKTGTMQLFRSHHPDYKDGEQLRDFIYVKDITRVILFLMNQRKHNGIYNLGTGHARTFLDLATSTFHAMGKEQKIRFIDTPIDIRDKYQYFTEAKMNKLRSIGYQQPCYTLEDGIADYVNNYLMKDCYR